MSLYSQSVSNNPLTIDGLITVNADEIYVDGSNINDQYAKITGADFTGIITALTPDTSDASIKVATTQYVVNKISSFNSATITPTSSNIPYYLVGTSPTSGALQIASINTLFYYNPATATLSVPSISTSGTSSIAGYALLSGATFTGPISTTNISVSGTSSIAGYVSDTSLNTTLTNYVPFAFANATFLTISNASSTYALITSLSNYLLTSTFNSTIANYVLTSSLNSTLSNYVLTSSLNSTLTNYVLTSSLNSTLTNYALKSGTTFTGPVYGITATLTDSDTKFSTTAFVKGQNYLTSSALTPYAPLASPTFTGTVIAPTQNTSDNSTKVSTTQYVKNNLASYAPLTNAVFTTPFTVNGTEYGGFSVGSQGNISCGNVDGNNGEFTTLQLRGGGISNPVNALLGIDTTTGYIWRTTGSAIATVTTTSANVNYSIIGTNQDSGALASAYIDALPRSFYFNPSTGILTAPSITTTTTSSIFGYLTTASASATYAPISILSNYALLSGATFTGPVNGLTADLTDNDSKFATTAFVKGQGYALNSSLSSYLPLSGGTLYSAFGPLLKLTLDSTGNTNYLQFNLISFPGAFYTGTLYGDAIHYATNNCYYGVAAAKSHKFYVNNSNRLEIDSVKTVITGQLGVNTTAPVGALSVLLNGTADNNPNDWTVGHALFGPGANSTTGSAVALTYNTAGNYGALVCLTPSVAWRDMYYSANSHSFKVGNTNLMTINGAGNVVATGTVSGTTIIGNNINLNGVPDFRILGGGINFYLNNVQCGFWDKPDASTWRISSATSSYLTLNAPTKVSLQVGYTEYLGIAPTFLTTPNTLSTSGLASYGQIHVNYGGYNVMQRNDGGAYYILIGNGVDAQWNGLRPFYITLNDGKLFSQNSQSFNGGCNIDVLSLNTTSQQSYQPRQVLIGNNQNVVQYGQFDSFAFRCGGAGIGWAGGMYMNTVGNQSNYIQPVADNFMIKYSSSSKITISGTFSGYVGSSGTMNCIFYFYNYYTGAYTYVGQWSQFSNVASNHACGGLHATLEFLPTGNYLVYMYGTGVNTDYNDHCSFSVIIHP